MFSKAIAYYFVEVIYKSHFDADLLRQSLGKA